MSLLDSPTFSPFCSTPPPTFSTWTSAPPMLTRIRSTTQCATSPWSGPSGHLADPTPRTGYQFEPSSSTFSSKQPPAFDSKRCSYADELRFIQQHWALGARQRLCCRFIPQRWAPSARQQFSCSEESVWRRKRHPDSNSARTSSVL